MNSTPTRLAMRQMTSGARKCSCRRYAASAVANTGFMFWINAIFLAACAGAGQQGFSEYGVAFWLTMASIELGNAGYHVLGTIRTRRYSPGVVTGVLLYVPISLYGYWFFVTSRLASRGTAVVALALGLLFPVWSLWNHRRRAAKVA